MSKTPVTYIITSKVGNHLIRKTITSRSNYIMDIGDAMNAAGIDPRKVADIAAR